MIISENAVNQYLLKEGLNEREIANITLILNLKRHCKG